MLIVVIMFIPIVIGYQIWAHNLFKGKVTKEDIAYKEAYWQKFFHHEAHEEIPTCPG